MIDLALDYLQEVRVILAAHVPDCEVRAIGSRITGRAQKYSDLDLVLVGEQKLDRRRIKKLKDAFSESDLPIMVDVLDWHAITPEFRKIVEKQYEVIQQRAASGHRAY